MSKLKFALLIVFMFPCIAGAKVEHPYPRLAKYFLHPRIWDKAWVEELAKWDVVILDMEVQAEPQDIELLRKLNPDIVILAYITSEEFLPELTGEDYPLRTEILSNIKENWWLKDTQGNKISAWDDTSRMFTMSFDWSDFLAKFLDANVIKSGLWDGLFYDCVWEEVSWVNSGNIDMDNNGIKDNPESLDKEWKNRVEYLLSKTVQYLGESFLLVGNGPSRSYYHYLNGIMLEEFPAVYAGGWEGSMEHYQRCMEKARSPRVCFVASDGEKEDYRMMRFTLTCCLLGDGYFSYDRPGSHTSFWWYDEYDASLGYPKAKAYKLESGVFRRDFDKGIVFCNPTLKTQRIVLEKAFRKIKGDQEPVINDGSEVSEVTIASKDGIILLNAN
ncbi:MAG: hypothetical protein JW734_05635 [Candidatus Omnitrophica bacterium]|nr:hypothetical protein [Candidatus Omnitrophota bacterium]